MKIFYFLVTGHSSWDPKYHDFFFNNQGGFLYGVLWALGIAIVMACIFYFVLCNNKKSNAMAKIQVWAVFLVLTGALSYLVADWGLIGKKGANSGSVFYKYSFYDSNEKYYRQESPKFANNQAALQQLAAKKEQIKTDLNHGKDVRLTFDLTTVFWSLLFFYLVSICIKGKTRFGIPIPHKWPSK